MCAACNVEICANRVKNVPLLAAHNNPGNDGLWLSWVISKIAGPTAAGCCNGCGSTFWTAFCREIKSLCKLGSFPRLILWLVRQPCTSDRRIPDFWGEFHAGLTFFSWVSWVPEDSQGTTVEQSSQEMQVEFIGDIRPKAADAGQRAATRHVHRSEIVGFAILWRNRTVEDRGPGLSQVIEMGWPGGLRASEPTIYWLDLAGIVDHDVSWIPCVGALFDCMNGFFGDKMVSGEENILKYTQMRLFRSWSLER